jgi:hypothetical protein
MADEPDAARRRWNGARQRKVKTTGAGPRGVVVNHAAGQRRDDDVAHGVIGVDEAARRAPILFVDLIVRADLHQAQGRGQQKPHQEC